MEVKNCPDPRNCSKIHFFGKCPYKHKPCNRGTACPYVNQNNCQFYHPEGDYPQYKTTKLAKAKKDKRTTAVKIVSKPSTIHLSSMASKAFAKMAALSTSRSLSNMIIQPQSPVEENQSKAFAKMAALSTSHSLSNMIIQPQSPVEENQTVYNIPPPPPPQKSAERTGSMISKGSFSSPCRENSGSVLKSSENKIPNCITNQMKKQEMYIKDLERRIQTTEKRVEYNRERSAGLESSKEKLFNCWTRAVKMLEQVRDSGTLLDMSIAQAIENQTDALRMHEGCSIYAPGLADLNPRVQKTEYFIRNGAEERRFLEQREINSPQRDFFPEEQNGKLGFAHNSMFNY